MRDPFCSLPLKRVIAARIERYSAPFQMQDMVDNIVQQIALMADDEDSCAIILEEILQPQGRLEVEMVGGLIEQQQVGRREQQRTQRDAHLPAARIAVEWALLHLLVKPQSDEYAPGPRRRAVGVDGDQPVVHIAEPVRVFAGLAFGEQRGALRIGGKHGLERCCGAAGGFLRDIAQTRAARHVDAAAIGLDLADDRLHQRRFSGTISSDQADTRTRRQGGTGAIEDRASAQADTDIIDCQHRAPLAQTRRNLCSFLFCVPKASHMTVPMDFQDLLVRYFGQADIEGLPSAALTAGVERMRVDFGLEKNAGRRFALWTLMYMLDSAPDLDVAFEDAVDRDAARDFMDMVDKMG